MADPPRRAPLATPARLVPRQPGRRVHPDCRTGVSEAITRFLDETRSTSDEQTLLEALTSALRVVMPVSAVELTQERGVPATAPVIRPSLIMVPIGRRLSDGGGVLQVRTAAGYTPDPLGPGPAADRRARLCRPQGLSRLCISPQASRPTRLDVSRLSRRLPARRERTHGGSPTRH